VQRPYANAGPGRCPPVQMGEGPLALGQQMHRDAVELRRRRAPRLHSYTATCGIADTVKTKFKVEPGDGKHPDDRWYAWLKEEWVAIPAEKIVPDFAPDGQAYLFLLAGTIQCFVKPKGGL
jgi:hypothetical protein